MADHYYSIAHPEDAVRRQRSDIIVGTSATTANPIELRVTDNAVSARQLYQFAEFLADLAAKRDVQVIATDTLL